VSDWTDRMNLVCFEPLKHERPWEIDTYAKIGGYEAWRRILAERTPREQVIEMVKASGLRGRGGAGFPTASSGRSCRATRRCRSTSSATPTRASPAPATTGTSCATTARAHRRHGDRRLRDGCHGRIQLHPRRVHGRARAAFRGGIEGAYAAGLLGRNLQGSGVDFDLYAFVGAGAYICGEETALLESLEGKQGKPRFKPPFPANFGLYGKPTTINNAQSFASVPTILRKGPSGSPAWARPTRAAR